ncbi:MAG: hypothetical protein AAB657_02575 [Patescibacteria group bacterium]
MIVEQVLQINTLKLSDISELKLVYQQAFAGFPWYESLSNEEVDKRWQKYINASEFCGLVATKDGVLVGGHWWNIFTQLKFAENYGYKLADFVKSVCASDIPIIWEAGLVVLPKCQGDGSHIGTRLRTRFIDDVTKNLSASLIISRMRGDNLPTIKIAEKLGFRRTGIKTPSSQKVGVFHEYWYLKKGIKNE